LNGATFNNVERLRTRISRSRHFSTLNISETTPDRAIVTTEHQQEVACTVSYGDISNDLQ